MKIFISWAGVILFLFILGSCSLFSKYPQKRFIGTSTELGVICDEGDMLFRNKILYVKAIPVFSQPVRINIKIQKFTRTSYRAYVNTAKDLGVTPVSFQDTVGSLAHFVYVSLLDNVAVINALKEPENKSILAYIRENPQSQFLGGLSMYVNSDFLEIVRKSDACYLQTSKGKKQLLYFYKDAKRVGKIDMQEHLVFSYDLSRFCWGIARRKKIELQSIIRKGERCPKLMRLNANELLKPHAVIY